MIGGVLEMIQYIKWWDLGLKLGHVISKLTFLITTQSVSLAIWLIGSLENAQ